MRNDIPSSRDEVGGIVGGKLWGSFATGGSVCLVLGVVEDNWVLCALLKWGRSYGFEAGVGCVSNEGLLWLRKFWIEGDHVTVGAKDSNGFRGDCDCYATRTAPTLNLSLRARRRRGGYNPFVYIWLLIDSRTAHRRRGLGGMGTWDVLPSHTSQPTGQRRPLCP